MPYWRGWDASHPLSQRVTSSPGGQGHTLGAVAAAAAAPAATVPCSWILNPRVWPALRRCRCTPRPPPTGPGPHLLPVPLSLVLQHQPLQGYSAPSGSSLQSALSTRSRLHVLQSPGLAGSQRPSGRPPGPTCVSSRSARTLGTRLPSNSPSSRPSAHARLGAPLSHTSEPAAEPSRSPRLSPFPPPTSQRLPDSPPLRQR